MSATCGFRRCWVVVLRQGQAVWLMERCVRASQIYCVQKSVDFLSVFHRNTSSPFFNNIINRCSHFI
jgi:hypothetical protein